MKYSEIYEEWRDNPVEFWKKNAEDVSWIKFPEKILTKKNENFYEWFSDGVMNTCYNAVDKNILEGRGDQVAIYYDSPITNSKSFRLIRHPPILESMRVVDKHTPYETTLLHPKPFQPIAYQLASHYERHKAQITPAIQPYLQESLRYHLNTFELDYQYVGQT